MDISHIEKTNIDQIKAFFYSHYAPNNAVLTLTGNISADKALMLAEKWFGPIERRIIPERSLPAEPVQTEHRSLTISKDVPSDALYKVWHVCDRKSPDFYTLDLVTDLLAGGESGRLYTKLVREKKLFSEINAYISSDIDPGLLIVNGKLMKGIDLMAAENAVDEVIAGLSEKNGIIEEMEKVKNKFEASTVFQNTSILNKAINLAFCELLGNPDLINTESDSYRKVTMEMVFDSVKKYFTPANSSTLYYRSTK
jgi:predicted Zn-dependent peptidase